jgi:hypothetical protein
MVRFVLAALLSATLVACQGEQGPPGPAGPPGPTGPPVGAVSNRYCWKATGGLLLQYQLVRFASGDLDVICAVSTVGAEYTATMYYKAGDTGTGTGLCRLFYDFDTANGGYWDFRADAPGERTTYVDPTSTQWNGWSYTFAAADCTG